MCEWGQHIAKGGVRNKWKQTLKLFFQEVWWWKVRKVLPELERLVGMKEACSRVGVWGLKWDWDESASRDSNRWKKIPEGQRPWWRGQPWRRMELGTRTKWIKAHREFEMKGNRADSIPESRDEGDWEQKQSIECVYFDLETSELRLEKWLWGVKWLLGGISFVWRHLKHNLLGNSIITLQALDSETREVWSRRMSLKSLID